MYQSRDPSGYECVTGHQCRCRKCPLYTFTKRLGELLSTRSCYGTNYPDWKQFTRYFDIGIPVSEEGAVTYWVYDHKDKDQHTIQCILEFAETQGHSPLLNQFEELIKGINNNKYSNPSLKNFFIPIIQLFYHA